MPGGIRSHKKTGNRWSVWGWSTPSSVNERWGSKLN